MKSALKRLIFKLYKVLPVRIRFWISYLNSDKFLVDVVAFILKDNKLLLVKQTYQHSWGLVGGWVKRGESIEDSIKREVMEELGLVVEVKSIQEVRSVPDRPVIDIVLSCNVVGGKLRIDREEVEEARFFDVKDLPKILPPHQFYVKKFLKEVQELNRG